MGKADRKPPRSNRREARRDTPAVGEPRAPYAALARPAADELPEELAPHAAELGRMLSFIDLAQGFALAFAECNLERVRKSLIQVVRQRCEAAGTRVVSLDLREVPSLDAPLDVIASRLPDADEGAGKQVVMLCGLEAHVEITDPSPAALAALNMARDAFPRRLPHPLIVWLPDDLLTALSRVAPDFWAWRSATFRFPAPRPVLESVYQQAFSADARVLDAEVGEVRRRIRVLEELLQEYLPSTGKPAPDRIPGALDILNELGMAYWGLGQAARAVQYFERMLDLARLSGPRRQEARAHGNLGSAYAALGELRKAIEYHEQALRISREIGDRRVEGTAVGNLGNAYAALGEPRKAIEYYEQALRIAREIGDRRGEANALGNLGTAYADLGEARKAIEHYEQALGIAREIGDRRGEASRLGNLGNAYAALGEPRKAIEHYEQALRIAREIGDRRGEGSRLGNLGIAYAALGEPRKAIEYHEQALRIHREVGDRRGEASRLGNLGIAYAALGEPRKAIEHFEQALRIAREVGDRAGEATASWNLGVVYRELGDLARAVELMQVRVDYDREVGHSDAEKDAATVEELRKKMAEGQG